MKKFKFLVKYGLLKRIGRKSFIIANLVIAILSIIIINLPAIISFFGGGDDEITEMNIQIVDEIDLATLQSDLSDKFNLGLDDPFYLFETYSGSSFNPTAFWEDENLDVVFKFEGSVEDPVVTLYSKYPDMNSVFINQIELQLISYQLGEAYERPQFGTVLAPDYEDPNEGMMIGSIASLLILPLFILVTMATQFVGVDIIEEKSTKAIETIIASVPSNTHFLSKIVAAILFVIIQGGLILLYGLIATLVAKVFSSSPAINLPQGEGSLLDYLATILPNWPILLLMTVLFIVIGTLFYLVVAALFASMAVTQEDYQQFQSPLMLMLLGGFYIGIFAPMANGEGFMRIMAFVPIFAPMVAPVAIAGGSMTILQGVIALLVLVLFFLLLLYFASPVYKVAILNYDQTKFFKRIGDNFKKAFKKSKK
ncbi:MAG: ABC transporter permease [Acholeplasmataceae bacterium]|jgi:ABC-2 type transport system permease protein|nr:ABC transporter permease [Acholeplasmataceae bacterium]